MKRGINSLVLALAMVVGLAAGTTAYAQEINRSIVLKRDAKVGGQVLPKGEYALKYVEGKDELVILQGKREILSATYKVTKLDKAAPGTIVIYSEEADGSFQLKRIEFKGKDSALVLENTVAKVISK
jgi:sulfur carrier protein ThiS